MQIEDLPYPVYCYGSPDYTGVLFSVDLDQIESDDPLYFKIRGKFDIQNKDIMELIMKGDACFGLLIECDYTDYRELRPCTSRFEEKLIKAYFSELVTVTPVIYAVRDIVHYTNSELIVEMASLDITLPEGAIIAADGELELNITRSQPQTVESICKIKPDVRSGYDIDGDSIILFVPQEVFDRYIKMTKNQKIQVTSMYFPPVLQSIIYNIFAEGVREYSDRKWYGSIKDTLSNKGIDPTEEDPYNVMMEVLKELLVEGASYIPIQEGDSNDSA